LGPGDWVSLLISASPCVKVYVNDWACASELSQGLAARTVPAVLIKLRLSFSTPTFALRILITPDVDSSTLAGLVPSGTVVTRSARYSMVSSCNQRF
jgi:hypothetical protein